MVFATIHRSFWTRLLAAFIVVLVVSPYSEPFATMDGTDFGGAGAVDVGPTSKIKPSEPDVLVPLPIIAVVDDVFAVADRPLTQSVTPDSRQGLRAVLRL